MRGSCWTTWGLREWRSWAHQVAGWEEGACVSCMPQLAIHPSTYPDVLRPALSIRCLAYHCGPRSSPPCPLCCSAGGSPFACACAALMLDRVQALVLVCPLMPTAGREEQLLPGG